MVRIINTKPVAADKAYIEVACLSTDTKPTANIATGSILTETDTGKVYFFDEAGAAGSEWVEQFSFQGE